MQTGLHIGNTQTKESVTAIADALMDFLGSGAEQETIRAAIKAFATMAEIKNMTFNKVNITGDKTGPDHAGIVVAVRDAMQQAHDDLPYDPVEDEWTESE